MCRNRALGWPESTLPAASFSSPKTTSTLAGASAELVAKCKRDHHFTSARGRSKFRPASGFSLLRRRRQGRALKLDTITGSAACVKRICPIYRQLEAHVARAKSLAVLTTNTLCMAADLGYSRRLVSAMASQLIVVRFFGRPSNRMRAACCRIRNSECSANSESGALVCKAASNDCSPKQ